MANSMTSEISRSYNSFSGSDIRALIGPYPFAEMQAVSYSITREKAPIYTCGSPDPRAYSRNKRGIAGSLVWVNFDRHALLSIIAKAKGTFVANKDEVMPQFQMETDNYINGMQVYNTQLGTVGNVLPVSATINQYDNPVLSSSDPSSFKMTSGATSIRSRPATRTRRSAPPT